MSEDGLSGSHILRRYMLMRRWPKRSLMKQSERGSFGPDTRRSLAVHMAASMIHWASLEGIC